MSNKELSILVVEDEMLLSAAISKKMEVLGIKSFVATTGKEAIDYLGKSEVLPGAIWLDYYLKDMNGLDFINELKKNPKWSAIPVVVVSNSATDEKVHSMLSLGVKKYILKAKYGLEEIINILIDVINEPNK